MNLLGYSVLLIIWRCCTAQGKACDYPEIEGGKLGVWFYRFSPSKRFPMEQGRTIDYVCNEGFATASGSQWGRITCTLHGWDPTPKCFQPEQCDQAPPIANGDVVGTRMEKHHSGTYVDYKCQPYYTPEGSTRVNCLNGAWSALPLCLEPCTASSQEMAANNIQLRWTDEDKVYLQHGQWIHFSCISQNYVNLNINLQSYIYKSSIFRVQCNRGNLTYPKCIERGSCVISQADMESKNIITERENTGVPNGETVSFTCKPGFYSIPGKDMKEKCIEGTLNYPECSPCLIHQEDLDTNNVVLHEKHKEVNYQNNATIEFKCKTGFFRTGPLLGTCFQGKIGYPLCLSERPCLLSKELIDENNLKFNATSGNIDYVENGKTITFSCKDQYRKHLSSSDLTQVCDEEIIAYPICLRKKTGPLV